MYQNSRIPILNELGRLTQGKEPCQWRLSFRALRRSGHNQVWVRPSGEADCSACRQIFPQGSVQTSFLGWSVSALVHGFVLAMVATFSLHPAKSETRPEKAPFRWEVSLLAAPPSDVAVADSMQASAVAAVTDTSQAEIPEASPSEPVVQRTGDQKAVLQEKTVSSMAPSQWAPAHSVFPKEDMLEHTAMMPAVKPAESPLPPPQVDRQRDSSRLEVETQIDSPTVQQRPQSVTRPVVNRTTFPDYTWLMDTLRTKLERVKVYPASARANEVQGRVVVQVSIHGDGRMTNSEIEESSGHPVLDQAALDTVRAASPLELTHLLEGPPVVMLVPLNYQLE